MAASPITTVVLGGMSCILGLAGLGAWAWVELGATDAEATWPLIVWGFGWLAVGAVLLDLPRRVLGRRFPNARWDDLGGGALLLLAGLALCVVPMLDARDGAFAAGPLVVGLAGVVFGLGGVWVLHGALLGPSRSDTRFARVVVALLLTSFAAIVGLVAGWLALDPPRPDFWWIPLPGALLLAGLAVNAWLEVVRR